MPLLFRNILDGANNSNSRISAESRHGDVKAITVLLGWVKKTKVRSYELIPCQGMPDH